MAPNRRGDTIENPIPIDYEHPGTVGRETSSEKTGFPIMAEGREGPSHGLPLNDFVEDDQVTVDTEVATPPPTLTEDMVGGALHHQPPDIERDQEPEATDLGFPPESTIATTDGEHMYRQSAIDVSQDTDPVHPVGPIPPNKVPESASTPRRPVTSNYSGCNASDSSAVGSSAAHSILLRFLSAFLPSWEIIGVYPDNGFLEVQLRIPDTGARKRSAPEPEPPVNDGPGKDSGPQPRNSKRVRWHDDISR
ncbi:hypothetical protein KXX57_001737 [Aspergillus fumigatus]|uniref:Uncharacterized protein n=1 Tax=Aspergillus fumigatus TaxID=746128 RepID=A0A229Y459_ASPFM|nr:hypothetical protein KXX32_001957 [Aspergillus fumigatus]KAH1548451.1 hypothetical protein KXX57_001737 [Aspergillus fumigatus]KAH1894939.1 hypothetical protein KXV57_002033 [Aspergillus fumigatus]KAH2273020.1 hypothetical protein KXW02_000700 [Aspergillus fumigatus]KAH2659103.1 hypothetical protein KXV32_001517 [Aspergillus fumigatus]